MLQPGFTYEQVQQVQVQLNLQILNCCSRAAVHESVRNTLLTNFNSFRVFRGLSTQNWMLVTIWCSNHMQMVVHIGHVIIVVYKLQHCDSRDKEVIYCDVKKTVFLSVLLRFYPFFLPCPGLAVLLILFGQARQKKLYFLRIST